MSLDNRPVYSGGCQCGAVRFRVEGALGDASICHCRMCQKACGNFYLPLVSVRGAKLDWTRGEPKRFRSSNAAWRGFCGDCGTPLTLRRRTASALAIGAFDDPAEIAPIDPVGHRGEAALCRPRAANCPARTRWPIIASAAVSWPTSSPTSIPTTTPNTGRRRTRP